MAGKRRRFDFQCADSPFLRFVLSAETDTAAFQFQLIFFRHCKRGKDDFPRDLQLTAVDGGPDRSAEQFPVIAQEQQVCFNILWCRSVEDCLNFDGFPCIRSQFQEWSFPR